MGFEVPFEQPAIIEHEFECVEAAVLGGHTSSSGRFSRRACDLLSSSHGRPAVVFSRQGARPPYDVGIVPSFTFVSTALAFSRAGAKLVFADIEPDTWGSTPAHVRRLLDEVQGIRAVVAVHSVEIGCDLDGLTNVLFARPGVELIEDNDHGLLWCRRRPAPGGVRMSTLSFHETKNFVCGEGGALVLNDSADIDRAHSSMTKAPTVVPSSCRLSHFLIGSGVPTMGRTPQLVARGSGDRVDGDTSTVSRNFHGNYLHVYKHADRRR